MVGGAEVASVIAETTPLHYDTRIALCPRARADVMVVGDDNQTINEWRGARPDHILRKGRTVFTNKPCQEYTLSRSFRFGPVIAQCAQDVISFNRGRSSSSHARLPPPAPGAPRPTPQAPHHSP